VPGSGLGILSKLDWSAYERPVPLDTIEPNLRARIEGGDLLIYSKTNRPSSVHRRARMDYIGVRKVSAEGRIIGETRMVGLFTSKAYSEPASKTPLLHRKLEQILDAEDLYEGSHDYKALVTIFESFPKDELFSAPTDELREQVMGLLQVHETKEVRLFARRDPYGRSVSLLVAMPRDAFVDRQLDFRTMTIVSLVGEVRLTKATRPAIGHRMSDRTKKGNHPKKLRAGAVLVERSWHLPRR